MSTRRDLDVHRLAEALSVIGVLANGTWVSFSDEDAITIAARYAALFVPRGRVTSQRLDMRLKHNRSKREETP